MTPEARHYLWIAYRVALRLLDPITIELYNFGRSAHKKMLGDCSRVSWPVHLVDFINSDDWVKIVETVEPGYGWFIDINRWVHCKPGTFSWDMENNLQEHFPNEYAMKPGKGVPPEINSWGDFFESY